MGVNQVLLTETIRRKIREVVGSKYIVVGTIKNSDVEYLDKKKI